MRAFTHILAILICISMFGITGPIGAATTDAATMRDGRSRNSSGTDQHSIPVSKFHELFHAYICESMAKDPDDIALSRLKITGNRPIAAGKITYQIFQKSKGIPKGYVRLTVSVSVDGITATEVSLSAWVDVYGSVVCAARSLKKGETIGLADVYLARKNISRMPANIITDKSKAIGLSAKNSLNVNTCIREYMLIRMPTLERGELVTILAQTGGLKITTPGKTLERGFEGELIRVQNTMSKKKIYARIVDDATVEVDF